MTNILYTYKTPIIVGNVTIGSPLFCHFSCKGIVQQGSFARFMGIEDGLHLFLGSIELGKQRLDACDNALLFRERRHTYGCTLHNLFGYMLQSCSTMSLIYQQCQLLIQCILKKFFIEKFIIKIYTKYMLVQYSFFSMPNMCTK